MRNKVIYALVDCNNFYASCERVFRPDLNDKPVAVLSNNDGCIVARSNEVKALGIPMGVPIFKIREEVIRHNIQVFSSNYQLYGDMSDRVMNVLQQFCSDVEIYSIDEAFIKFHFYKKTEAELMDFCKRLRQTILQWTGIPVSVGIATSKTLCKLANHIAKKRTKSGVYSLLDESQHEAVLSTLDISKVWGVGRQTAKKLCLWGVQNVWQLRNKNEKWIRQLFNVNTQRTVRELKGFPCFQLENAPDSRKHIMVSRSFRKDVENKAELYEAVATYATRLGEKLRRYKQTTKTLNTFLMVNRFRNSRSDGRTYFSAMTELPYATSNTNQLINAATAIVDKLYEEGTNYKKAGVLAGDLFPESHMQLHLFDAPNATKKSAPLMKVVDELNRKMGKNTIYFSACGVQRKWYLKSEYRSPRYTTKWEDLLVVK